MTLEDAIEHAEKEVVKLEQKCEDSCAEDHRQLASWLKQLKDPWIPITERLLFEEDAQKYFDSFIEGAEYVPRQYLSTTKNGVYNDDAQVQIYIQNAKNGRDLGKLNDMESEVLYPFMSRFRVLNKVKQDGKFYILLEELE